MKSIYILPIILCLLFVNFNAVAQDPMYEGISANQKKERPSVKNLDEKYGFRSVKLESDFSTFEDMVLKEKEGSIDFYTRTSDELTIWNYSIEPILYGFYKNKLLAIAISTKGLSNSRGVLEVLQAQYGQGYQKNRYIKDFVWDGQKTRLTYNENSITSDSNIMIISKDLSKLMFKEEGESAKKAAADDF